MGNLLKVLYNKESDSPNRVDIFVDFENAQPTERELQVWSQVGHVLKSTGGILLELTMYRGASNEIRDAISNPKVEESQERAWATVVPLVSQLKRFYEFSLEFETTVPNLLSVLCSNEMPPRRHLETQQALFKQFAEILDFTLKFDDLKMTNPAIQNDFSYYRRTLSRLRMTGDEDADSDLDVTNAMANRMSLFYAHATPMLRVLGDTTSKFVSEHKDLLIESISCRLVAQLWLCPQHKDLPIENTTDCLSTMASICRVMIQNPKYRMKLSGEESIMFCLRVMVGVIILYDHVHPLGAFVKSSNIDIKNSIKVLKEHAPCKVECLLNALRYTTKHLNDDSTHKSVRNSLG